MGIIFGTGLIIFTIIYVARRLWNESTQDHKDITKQVIPIVCLAGLSPLFLILLCNWIMDLAASVSLDALEITANILTVLLIVGFGAFIVWIIIWREKANSPTEIRKEIKREEKLIKTRIEEFRESFGKCGYDIYPEGYEILAKEYRLYAARLDIREAYTWISKKASINIMLYGDREFMEELGITTKNLPDSFTETQQKYALRYLCAEKLGLYYSDNINQHTIDVNKVQIIECIRFAKSYYADILKKKAPRIKL